MMRQVEEEVSFTINRQLDDSTQSLNLHVTSEDGDITQSPIQTQSQSLFAGLSHQVKTRTIDPQPDESTRSLNSASMQDEMDPSPIRSQSQSLFARPSTPVTRNSKTVDEDNITDRFNGILYHVIPDNGQITIIFSTNDLYRKFIVSIEKELNARPISDVRAMYTTHILGKYCVLTSDDSAASITATGPAHLLWRGTVFARLAIKLYQQYAGEMDNDISRSQIQYQTSTPAGPLVPESPTIAPAERQTPHSDAHQVMGNIASSVIIGQIAELQQTSKLLQQQLHNITTKIDTLLLKSQDVPRSPTIHELSAEPTLGDCYVTLSTTGDDPPVTPGTASYSEVLITEVQNENGKTKNNKPPSKGSKSKGNTGTSKSTNNKKPKNDNPMDKQQNPSTPNSDMIKQGRTLIIGDSILSGVNRKGLNTNVECQPIPGATIDMVIDKIHLFDLTKFDNTVVYVGGNDSSQHADPEFFEMKYDQLISHIKTKNPDCAIYLCTSCPRGDTDVTETNDMIQQLCDNDTVKCINTNAAFYDKDHQLRHHFYKLRDNIHLSRSGVKRVLGTINQHLGVVDNFQHCVFPISPSYTTGSSRPTYNIRESQEPSITEGVRSTPRPRHSHLSSYQNYDRRQHNVDQRTFDNRYQHNYEENRHSEQNHSENNRQHKNDNASSQYQDMEPPEHRTEARCLKCGLTNHSTVECRHANQVQCYKCKLYGHKDSSHLCWNR